MYSRQPTLPITVQPLPQIRSPHQSHRRLPILPRLRRHPQYPHYRPEIRTHAGLQCLCEGGAVRSTICVAFWQNLGPGGCEPAGGVLYRKFGVGLQGRFELATVLVQEIAAPIPTRAFRFGSNKPIFGPRSI
jgi:hypothetical protein